MKTIELVELLGALLGGMLILSFVFIYALLGWLEPEIDLEEDQWT